MFIQMGCIPSYICLLRKPLHIPSTRAFDILDNQFETLEVQSSDSVETHIKQDHGPLKEGIDRIGYTWISSWIVISSRGCLGCFRTSCDFVHFVL